MIAMLSAGGARERLGRALRDVRLLGDRSMLRARGRGVGRVVFFPSGRANGASLLRAYNIARQLAGMGWRTLVVPTHVDEAGRMQVLRALNPDFVFVQMARHPLNRARLLEGRRFAFDIDDADYLDQNHTENVKDLCESAAVVFAGSRNIARWCRQYAANVRVVWTGTPASIEPPPQARRKPIVTWAPSIAHEYPHESELMAQAVVRAWERGGRFVYRMYGAKDGKHAAEVSHIMQSAGVPFEPIPPMSYSDFLRSLRDVSIGLQPIHPDEPYSQGKSFGKVLAYLDAGVAVVASDAVDHSVFFQHGRNGLLVRENSQWPDAILALLDDAALRDRVAREGRADFIARLTTHAAATLISNALLESLAESDRPPS